MLAFAPFRTYPLAFATTAVLFHRWRKAPTARAAARAGFWFGAGFFLCGVSWVYVSLHDFGAMPAPPYTIWRAIRDAQAQK